MTMFRAQSQSRLAEQASAPLDGTNAPAGNFKACIAALPHLRSRGFAHIDLGAAPHRPVRGQRPPLDHRLELRAGNRVRHPFRQIFR